METFASCVHQHSRIASVIVSRRDMRSLKEDLSDLNWLQACSYLTTIIPGPPYTLTDLDSINLVYILELVQG